MDAYVTITYTMWFKILYSLFFIAQLLYGNTYIGPVTPRQIMAVVMFLVLVKKGAIKFDKYFKLYLVFIVFFAITEIAGGYFEPMFRRCIGFYFVAYIAYQATKVLIKQYSGQRWLVWTFLIVALVDALVTIGYMYGSPFAPIIREFLHINVQAEQLEDLANRNMETLVGWAVPGLLQSVDNGYFLCIMSVISFSFIAKSTNIANYTFWLIILFALFCVQERTALFVAIVFSVFIILRNYKHLGASKGKKALLIIAALLVSYYAVPALINSINIEDSRYALKASLSSERGNIIKESLPFIVRNPLGGWDYYKELGFPNPHNLIINALVYGGWCGGLIVLYLVCLQLFLIFKLVKRKDYHHYYAAYIWGIAYICYTLNSITHNLSVIHGDPTIWILWGAFLANKEVTDEGRYPEKSTNNVVQMN